MGKAVEECQDVSELLQTGEPVVLAVDQVPFEVESRGVKNTFCLLVPLMTEGGLGLKREQFRNRERVWWMLRPDIPPGEIQVGTVWSGPIERSRAYGKPEKEKDHYQVRRADIRSGTSAYVEILNLKVTHPDLQEILSPEGIPWPHPPLPRVILRGGLSVVGPFSAAYDFETRRARLRSLDEEDPRVFRLSRAEFEEHTDVREYSYRANQWDAKAQEVEVELSLMHEKDLSVLQERGESLDGATDAQLVAWALEFMKSPAEGRSAFHAVFDKAARLAQQSTGEGVEERLGRFLKLCEERLRVVELGDRVAREIAERDCFRELVERHAERITADRVSKAVAERSAEIETATAEAEKRLEKVREQTAGLEEEYAARRRAWEEEFQKNHGEKVRALDEREAALEREEREMRERLEGLVNTFHEESSEFGDRLLAQIPIMERLGILRTGSVGSSSGPAPLGRESSGPGTAPLPSGSLAHVELELPSFLGETRERTNVDEETFLDQFRAVVERHGFIFDTEDLVNFHVLCKTGFWTVLAGTSGLGKSSLPRFYAEALGCPEEYLLIPVRPDWLDDRDVIGAFNALSSRYEPAPCGLVDRLITAREDEMAGRGGIYIVCLDEMNLARVEHYFAQFLSVLEQPESARSVQLFARGMLDPQDPYSRYRTLRLGSNIRLVGTVNVDETTHFFSPKVIDRVSIASFERPDLKRGLESEEHLPAPLDVHPVHLENYLSWVQPAEKTGEAVDLILKADEILRRSRLGLGFRVRDRMIRYISSARPILGEDRAADLAFSQNVLPALRPIAPRYMETLKELQNLLPEARYRRSARLLRALEEDPESDFFQLL